MSARASALQLVQAMKEISAKWEQTRASWHDVKSAEFEEKFLTELPQHVARAAAAMEEIETILRKARTDCE